MTTPAAPGRPRSFDLDRAVDGALELFWARGYRETSTRDLERALGIGQSSLYHAFGSKRELLMRAIDRYEARVRRELLDLLEPSDLSSVERFLEALGRWVAETDRRGCLVVSLMATATDDDVISDRVARYRHAVRGAFVAALEGSGPDEEVASRADFLVVASFGVHAVARTSTPAELAAMIAGLRAQVAAWTG